MNKAIRLITLGAVGVIGAQAYMENSKSVNKAVNKIVKTNKQALSYLRHMQ